MSSRRSIVSSITKIDDVDGLTVVFLSPVFCSLVRNHNVLVNFENPERVSFHEQVLFFEWKSRVLRLVESEPFKSIIILDEKDEEDGLASRSNVFDGAFGESKGNSQI